MRHALGPFWDRATTTTVSGRNKVAGDSQRAARIVGAVEDDPPEWTCLLQDEEAVARIAQAPRAVGFRVDVLGANNATSTRSARSSADRAIAAPRDTRCGPGDRQCALGLVKREPSTVVLAPVTRLAATVGRRDGKSYCGESMGLAWCEPKRRGEEGNEDTECGARDPGVACVVRWPLRVEPELVILGTIP